MELKDREQLGLVGTRLREALVDECESQEARYLWTVIPALYETWLRFCRGVLSNEIEDGAGLEQLAEDGEFWPERPALTKESHWAREVFGMALSDFREWDSWAKYLDGMHVADDDDDEEEE